MHGQPITRDERIQASLESLDALAARPWPRQPSCEGCKQFERDTINPPAGMGSCATGHGFFYPGEQHRCIHRQAK